MADDNARTDVEYDDDGNPIEGSEGTEGGDGTPPEQNKAEGAPADEGEGEGSDKDTDEPEIPVRVSALQHIIARKNRKIKDLKEGDNVEEGQEAGEDDIDDLTPEAREAVSKQIMREVGPIRETLASQADENELQSLFSADPEAKSYEKRIRAYMQHPSYAGVPPTVVYHHLAFEAALAQGARRGAAANLEAAQTRGGGRTERPSGDTSSNGVPSAEEIAGMSEDEFEALEKRAKAGEFLPPSQ